MRATAMERRRDGGGKTVACRDRARNASRRVAAVVTGDDRALGEDRAAGARCWGDAIAAREARWRRDVDARARVWVEWVQIARVRAREDARGRSRARGRGMRRVRCGCAESPSGVEVAKERRERLTEIVCSR